MNTEQTRQTQLSRAARYITPNMRAVMATKLADRHAMAPDTADAVLLTCIDLMLQTLPRKYVVTDGRDARDARVLEMSREGFSNADIADALGVTPARVSQILTELRASGADVPARKRGPRATRMPDALLAAPMFHAGLTVPDIAKRMTLPEDVVEKLHELLVKSGDSRLPPLVRAKDTLEAAEAALVAADAEYKAEVRAAQAFGGDGRLDELKAKVKAAIRHYRAVEALANGK